MHATEAWEKGIQETRMSFFHWRGWLALLSRRDARPAQRAGLRSVLGLALLDAYASRNHARSASVRPARNKTNQPHKDAITFDTHKPLRYNQFLWFYPVEIDTLWIDPWQLPIKYLLFR